MLRLAESPVNGLTIFALSGAYMAFLFAVAWRSEQKRGRGLGPRLRGLIYGLSLAVYCTSWTFYGAGGTAARAGWDYLPIYIGPILALTVLFPLWRRVAAAAKRENTGSIADFLSARYGKSPTVGALVAVVALVGALPYIALQLRSLNQVVSLLSGAESKSGVLFLLAAVLAGFAILFGARRVGLTEHNPGLVRAIAVESVVKLTALMAAALLAWLILVARPDMPLHLAPKLAAPPYFDLRFNVQVLLAAAAIFCLPRQFHMAFVELEDQRDLSSARVLLPTYLVLTSLAIVPIASAGLALPALAKTEPDLYVLALPLHGGAGWLTALVYVGGFSAATAAVVVETVALSSMASNQFVLPWLTERWMSRQPTTLLPSQIMGLRRLAIVAILAVASVYAYLLNSQENLASIGLSSFAASAQLAPALACAVLWRRAHSRGVIVGVSAGFAAWIVLLALPQLLGPSHAYSQVVNALLRGAWGFDAFTAAVVTSLLLNIAGLVTFSLLARPRAVDHVQARAFVSHAGRPVETVLGLGDELGRLQQVVARFIGEEAAAKGFEVLGRDISHAGPVDAGVALAAERLLAGAIGASSARTVIASALAGNARRARDVAQLLDDAAQAVQFNRELLQATLDNLTQGVSVVDADLRLVAWNAAYVQMFDLPPEQVYVGCPIADIIRYNALRGECGPGEVDDLVERRLEHLKRRRAHSFERVRPNGEVVKSTGAPMPNGGYLTSYSDITALRRALDALERSNLQLEHRVSERTEALEAAKGQAEAATASKTRFLAAASHDLLQPLHAARLFLAALETEVSDKPALAELVGAADQSIDSAHRLLRALLNLSKLEAGGVKPEVRTFPLAALFDELEREFRPQAEFRGLDFHVVHTSLYVVSDYDLVRSMLQNLIGNALRYTERGKVIVGCRRTGGRVRVCVWDTGPGIPEESQQLIFGAFTRLPGSGGSEHGVGLGLAIVQRVAELLGARVELQSRLGHGSMFAVSIERGASLPVAPSAIPDIAPSAAGLRVLCVDNEPAILRGLSAVLQRMGAEVQVARNAHEAANTDGVFDLALVDYHLDEGDGLALRAPLKHRVRRFVVVTADTSMDVEAAITASGAELVRKPIKPQTLKGLLNRA